MNSKITHTQTCDLTEFNGSTFRAGNGTQPTREQKYASFLSDAALTAIVAGMALVALAGFFDVLVK